MSQKNILLSSYNGYPQHNCNLYRPERYSELVDSKKPIIARGKGYSYGDCALNKDGNVITTERLNRFLTFDIANGTLSAEAGVTLQEVLQLIIPQGWFLPVTPGTQHATLGGCVAVDAHGKNHATQGSFGNHVQWLELITADGSILHCSADENSEYFWATIGGLGLTGIIGAVGLTLIPIKSSQLYVTYQHTETLTKTLQAFTAENNDYPYQVAWLDSNAKNNGRAIIMSAQHAKVGELILPKNKMQLSIPSQHFAWGLNKYTINLFNQLYYLLNSKKTTQLTSYREYFYPLDHIKHWNRLYGKKGFIQYQCSLPFATAEQGFNALLNYLHQSKQTFFLAVLKKLGTANAAPLSFATPGFTLALDIPINNKNIFMLLEKMDEIVLAHQGRIYLAKDARLTAENFKKMYPRYNEWLTIKNKLDPKHLFSSSLSRRLEIG